MRLLNLGKKSIKWSIFATNEQSLIYDIQTDDDHEHVSDYRFDAYVLLVPDKAMLHYTPADELESN